MSTLFIPYIQQKWSNSTKIMLQFAKYPLKTTLQIIIKLLRSISSCLAAELACFERVGVMFCGN